ncbi:MAG TPA: T9SS type A sorting domain-containing protein [Candidatus Kapabacteria bacterium]|nr:T9SS type A sorting domain-containing protein [Candidatus Kapabacteria bacterium]
MKTIYLFLVITLSVRFASAQTNFFVTIDPSTGAYTETASIPKLQVVYSTAYDQILNRFFFTGHDSNGYYRLYTLLATDGEIVSDPVIPAVGGIPVLSGLQFDNTANKLYGVTFNGSKNYFVSINTGSGAVTIIDSFASYSPVINATFDHLHGYYMLTTSSGTFELFTIRTSDGSVISDSIIRLINGCKPSGLLQLQYDDSTKRSCALAYANNVIYYGVFEPDSEVFVPKLELTYSPLHLYNVISSSYDQASHRFIFIGYGSDGYYPQDSTYLQEAVIDAIHDTVLSSSVLPNPPSGDSCAGYVEYVNSSRSLKGIMFISAASDITEPAVQPQNISVFPNPTSNTSSISLNKSYTLVTALITNTFGQTLRKDVFHDVSEINIERGGLPDGLYFIQLAGDGKPLGVVKLGVE